MESKRELDLVRRIHSGDYEAENELFTHFDIRIVRKVRFSLGTANDDWMDLVSEIKMALLTCLREGKFDLDRGANLGSYVYGITMNKIRDYFKLLKKNEIMTTNPPGENDLCAEDELEIENRETREVLRGLLEKLKLKYKEVLYLKYYEGLAISEISRKIKLPPRRVSERINYAIKLLRKEFEKEKYFQYYT